MNSKSAIINMKQRLNKLTSNKYDWISKAHFEEVTNKAMNDWFRRQIHGKNDTLEGDEESSMRVDDLQVQLRSKVLSIKSKTNTYTLTGALPDNYRYYKRLIPYCSNNTCEGVSINSKLVEEANVSEYLNDWTFQPSLDFEETFHTLIDNHFRIYTNDDFTVDKVELIYYKEPNKLKFINEEDASIEWEWKEDVAYQIIEEAVKLIAADTENTIAYQFSSEREQTNN